MTKDQTVDVDISKHPRSDGLQKGVNGGRYYNSNGGTVNLTSAWYPDPEGTYWKFTHTPKGGRIGKINKGYSNLSTITEFNNNDKKSASVFYWGQDYNYGNPLLIQLGEGGSSVYYITDNGTSWSKQGEISDSNLRKKLDERNCKRNGAHIVDISQKGNSGYTPYTCPGCSDNQKIKVSYDNGYSPSDYSYYTPFTHGSISFSVTSLKYNDYWQAGLPSLKDVKSITVYWYKTGSANPIIVTQFQQGGNKWFRRNTRDGNTWIEVSNTNALPSGTPPKLDLDLSKSSGITYFGGSTTGIGVAVRFCHIGDGYYRWQYSLKGGLFNVTRIRHENTQLSDITPPSEKLLSVSAYYSGYDLGNTIGPLSNLILVEVVTSETGTNPKYLYYQKENKDGTNWKELVRTEGGTGKQLVGEALKVLLVNLKEFKKTLSELKDLKAKLEELERLKTKSPESSTTTIAGSSVGSGLGGAGLGALAMWKGPSLLARLITRM
ncbi:hypothetical protein BEWA_044510 [Theileria equi strain WA]|uniref:Uncharacterized protein n=1 Tax=Theileria equi strain WA TaxID=1537102 RepID=L1LBF9_THEEQ|nr:hypothetical protein BEWA_044510 [Theileria equi strain WA]EKX72610.1 hypothetical protein BEWA_044510 [Theileria equi strain WA]|eukprot:XP_004832062.1 hypothetical protein BEWA_044510 [Theileria equi strain WA]